MKKLVTLLLAAGLVFSAAHGASAVEVKTSGNMNFAFDWSQNIGTNFQNYDDAQHNGSEIHQKHFGAVQRMRLTLDFVMSENLSATYQAQVGAFTWGGAADGNKLGGNSSEGNGGALGSRSGNIATRLAYLDWMIPNTSVKVRMGQQAVALPSFTFGSPVLDSTATGVVVAAPVTDNFGLTALWLRTDSGFRRGSVDNAKRLDDNGDVFGLIADVKGEGFQVQPWAAVGFIGHDSASYGGWQNSRGLIGWAKYYLNGNNLAQAQALTSASPENATAWMVGVSGELTMFDPFRFTGDFYYGALNADDINGYKGNQTSGWYAALGAEYKTAYGTPALKGWYASGDGKLDHNRPFSKSGGQAFAFWGKGGFNATSTFYDGAFPLGKHIGVTEPMGSWGIQAAWNDISFVENLSHALSVTYVQGTNNKSNFLDPDAGYLTTKDSFVEIDFNTTYNIYQNLATVLEIGYIVENFDGKNLARNVSFNPNYNGPKFEFSNAWRASLAFQYKF